LELDWKQHSWVAISHVDDPHDTPGSGGGGGLALHSSFVRKNVLQYQLSPFASQQPAVVTVPQAPLTARLGGQAIGLVPDGSAPWNPHA